MRTHQLLRHLGPFSCIHRAFSSLSTPAPCTSLLSKCPHSFADQAIRTAIGLTGSPRKTTPQFTQFRGYTINHQCKDVEPDTNTSDKLRKVLRRVPFPVVVVSTCVPGDPLSRRGITVSSFVSISLQPVPLVAFCVKLPSRASSVLHTANQFVVQFLAADQSTHSIAFSSSVPPLSSPQSSNNTTTTSATTPSSNIEGEMKQYVSEVSQHTLQQGPESVAASSSASSSKDSHGPHSHDTDNPDPFEILGFTLDPDTQIPVLNNTLGALRCKTHQVLMVGDHEMWIGHVEKVLHGEDPLLQNEPLLYHDRSYRKVGRRIL